MTDRMDTARLRPTRLQIALWLLILLITLGLALYDWSGYKVGTYGDDASYITNTDSLLARVPYGTLLFPGEPRMTQFPFVFPLLLAPVRALFPDSLDALRIVPLAFTLLALGVLFWGWRWIGGGLDYWWGMAVVALTAFSPLTILHARTVMSEAPFLFFSLLMIVLVERAALYKKTVRLTPVWGILLGTVSVLLVYTRSIGLLFIAVLLVYLYWKCGRVLLRSLGIAALTAALLLALVLVTTTVRLPDLVPQEYAAQFNNTLDGVPAPSAPAPPDAPAAAPRPMNRALLPTVLLHLDLADKLPYQMEVTLTEWTNQNRVAFLRYVPGVFGVALWLVGMAAWWRKTGLTAFQVVVLPYLALLGLWAWNGARLFYPVQPQLFLAILIGLFVVVRAPAQFLPGNRVVPRLAAGLTGLVCLLLIAGSVWLDLKFTRSMLLPGDPQARAAQIQQFIPVGAVVVSTRATTDHLYLPQTFRDPPPRVSSATALAVFMQRQAVDYVASHNGLYATEENEHLRIAMVTRFVLALDPLIKAGAVETLFSDPKNDLAIYRVDPEKLAAFIAR